MAFSDFLDIMHTHSKQENIPKELLDAFKGMDVNRKGTIPARDLWHILAKWGEKISPREGKTILGITGFLNKRISTVQPIISSLQFACWANLVFF